jgi:hypothetical protein
MLDGGRREQKELIYSGCSGPTTETKESEVTVERRGIGAFLLAQSHERAPY